MMQWWGYWHGGAHSAWHHIHDMLSLFVAFAATLAVWAELLRDTLNGMLSVLSTSAVQRQAPLSFGGKPCGRLVGSNKKGRSNAAQGTLPVTAYFR